jgi:hypothetical protein
MRKAAFIGLALAAAVAFTFPGSSASAREGSRYQGQVTMLDKQLSNEPSRFNPYWFVYGVPPYDGVAPYERLHADPNTDFNSYWFVYGVPAPSRQHQAK